MLLTYLGKKFGEETEDSVQPEGVKPGSRVYLIVSDPLTKKDAALQRYETKNSCIFLSQFVFHINAPDLQASFVCHFSHC